MKNNGVTATQGTTNSLISTKNGSNNTDSYYWVFGQNNNTWQIRVWNNPGMVLPETGGVGTDVFAAVGGMTALFAGAVLAIRRKRRANEA